jgi:hypothetical protein
MINLNFFSYFFSFNFFNIKYGTGNSLLIYYSYYKFFRKCFFFFFDFFFLEIFNGILFHFDIFILLYFKYYLNNLFNYYCLFKRNSIIIMDHYVLSLKSLNLLEIFKIGINFLKFSSKFFKKKKPLKIIVPFFNNFYCFIDLFSFFFLFIFSSYVLYSYYYIYLSFILSSKNKTFSFISFYSLNLLRGVLPSEQFPVSKTPLLGFNYKFLFDLFFYKFVLIFLKNKAINFFNDFNIFPMDSFFLENFNIVNLGSYFFNSFSYQLFFHIIFSVISYNLKNFKF